ncbi:MAG: hypothetical protein ACREKS_24070 [Candidatus Rokuibacteriota bacterium]
MRARRLLLLVVPVVIVVMAGGAWLLGKRPPRPPAIAFAPYQDEYGTKPDFARLEHELPLTPAQRTAITPASLTALNQEQVNQLYARLTAGPIPDGPFRGDLFFPKGTSGDVRLAEIVGGLGALGLPLGPLKAEGLSRALWKGKVFYRDQRLLRNQIDDLADLTPLLGHDTSKIQRLSFEGQRTWLLFPAKLYCGQSLLDGRRESIVIDYAFSDDLEGYRENPDVLTGRHGLAIRDEIRMVRPGFYQGRTYMRGVFLLNFTLESDAIAKRDTAAFISTGIIAEDCWVGTQKVATLPR